jgi:predicted DNA-binding protein (UPF0251 family)
MLRLVKYRRVAFVPEVTYFKPAVKPLRDLEEIRLSLEEPDTLRCVSMERHYGK